MNTNFKKKPARSNAYMAFIRRQKCLICGRPDQIDAHHTESGGIATKGSDFSCIPLCWICHRKLHDSGSKRGDWTDEELSIVISNLRAKWLSEGNDKFWEEAKL